MGHQIIDDVQAQSGAAAAAPGGEERFERAALRLPFTCNMLEPGLTRRILLVEDEESLVVTLRDRLVSEGYAVEHAGDGVFAGLPAPLTGTRYHSLVLDPETIPECLEVTARTTDGVVMGVRHREVAVEGVQFHPESILTGCGHDLLRNFLATTSSSAGAKAL